MSEFELDPIIANYMDKTTNKKEIGEMQDKLRGVIDQWAEESTSMLIYKKYDYTIHDVVLFNDDKTKVLMFSCYIKNSKHGKVDLHGGQLKEDGKWYFHHSGLPGFSYEYDDDLREGIEFTCHELLIRSLDKMTEDGLISNGEINIDYINNKWFR